MDARAARHAGQAPDPIAVRISDPGGIAAAIPHLLGFRPRESVVLISLRGPTGSRVGLTVRGDLPPAGQEEAVARLLSRSVCSDRPREVLLVVLTEAPDSGTPDRRAMGRGATDGSGVDLPHRALVREFVLALAAVDVPVHDALLVRSGRWWSYDCPKPCCAPGAGTRLPAGVTELEVAAVATGAVVARDRADLGDRIARPRSGGARRNMAAACAAVAEETVARVLAVGSDEVAAESWSAVEAAVVRCRPGAPVPGGRLSDSEVARVVCGLRDVGVRDRALGLSLGPDAAAVEQLWTECTRRAPAPLDAAPATLLAVSVWLRGDGAMAGVALTRALDSAPDYGLARLLAQALAACLAPADLRSLLRKAAGLPGADRPGRR
ncbi:MAG: uncharacterized protein JWP33_2085 [Blastococcus sp.]|nr:uncharacterized protein [Blastococcus sp.]